MQAFRNKLQKHKTTRQLVSARPCSGEADDELEVDLRKGLAWQQRLVPSLLGYATAVSAALSALTEAHEALLEGGADDVKCAPVARAVLASLRDASRSVGDAISATHALRALGKTLSSYEDDLREADRAAAERKRYDEKVSNLADKDKDREDGQTSAPGRTRIERNVEKLRRVTTDADAAHTRALGALQACAARRDGLCDLANDVISASARALCSISAGATIADGFRRPAATNASDVAIRLPRQPASVSSQPAAAAVSTNPFDEDLEDSPQSSSCWHADRDGGGSQCGAGRVGDKGAASEADNPFDSDIGHASKRPSVQGSGYDVALGGERAPPTAQAATPTEPGDTSSSSLVASPCNITSPLLSDCHAQPSSGNPFDDDVHEPCIEGGSEARNPFHEGGHRQ